MELSPSEDEAKLSLYKEAFKDLLDPVYDEKIENIEIEFPNVKDSDYLSEYKKNWHYAHTVAARFFKTPASVIFLNHDWEELLSRSKVRFISAKIDQSTFDLSSRTEKLAYMALSLTQFLATYERLDIPLSKEFVNSKAISKDSSDALKAFIEIGQRIRNDKAYELSNTKKLEDVLLDKEQISKNYFKDIEAENPLDLSTLFVALAAPSMEGKTQSAFIFDRVRPLYFPLSQARNTSPHRSQPIYENFTRFANELFDCASSDLKRLNATIIPAEFLRETHEDTQLLTLGLLKALADHSRTLPEGVPWMQYYANIRQLKFYSASIAQAKDSFKGVILMLDEFLDNPEFIFVRNLARAAGLTCLVANTNTKIVNVVREATASGTHGCTVWSLVVTKLDPASIQVLNDRFKFSDSIDALIQKRKSPDDSINKFLNNLKSKHIHKLRPGVAVFVAQILNELVSKDEFTEFDMGRFLHFIGSRLRSKLCARKNALQVAYGAMLGHIGLLLPESYSPRPSLPGESENNTEIEDEPDGDFDLSKYDIDKETLALHKGLLTELDAFHQPRLIEEHLYHLVNPVDRNSNWFLTFPPFRGAAVGTDSPLEIYLNSNFASWDYEYTEFDPDEFLTILACHMIPMKCPSFRILIHARKILGQSDDSVVESVSLNAAELDGNCLEVSAAVCVAKASHCGDQDDSIFKGTKGSHFVRNIIRQMIVARRVDSRSRGSANISPEIQLLFDESEMLRSMLDRITVPFIYSIDNRNEHFDLLSRNNSSFFVSPYERTSNAKQIDGMFFARNSRNELVKVVCECKNYAKRIKTSILCQILNNVREKHKDAAFCFIFCNEVVDRTAFDSKFSKLCTEEEMINVYRIERYSSDKHHGIVPFAEDFNRHAKPVLNCIIFETLAINFCKKEKKKV